ncbi:protein-disulfide reductase DsbD family protein [Sphingobacterium sp. LRF_L2]|uniref:protein-disulfide reductase DsbD family protein n=1 Tax=Sphingobacterium sp. LRF_L2 TaxID=3369421 RepID=UPI003F5EFB6E
MKYVTFVQILIFSFFHLSSFGQQDSLISSEDIVFSEGTTSSDSTSQTAADSLLAVPDDLVFADGATDSVAQDSLAKDQTKTGTTDTAQDRSLWGIFITGLIGGFAAFIMPCIFPMVPLTVSFFTKRSGSRARAISQALLYGLFIIIIYVALGMLITITFGSDALNALSTNGVFNFIFFLVLVLFAASFFGAFELTLPSSFVNRIDAKSDQGGLIGLFFMAFSLALVSFSCTGPIIGTLLVDAASKGERMGPAIGMLGFSIALAIPFVLFAVFPSMLKSLPKSGGWLNSVKVVLGFLELALALKFLSNVDLAYHWDWLDREVFLALWIVIFGLMGLYLIGKISFAHDSPLAYLSVPRTIFAIVVFAFVVYMVPGMWGAPLKSISAFLPPSATQDFDLSVANFGTTASTKASKTKKYYDIFHKRGTPKGFEPYYEYEEGLAAAKEQGKPALIDFTGWNCVNCRKMEANVWTDPQVASLLKNEFVMIELFVDDRTALQPEEQYVSSYSGKKINSIGKKNSDFQAATFNSNSQPQYVIVDTEGNVLLPPSGANYDVESYANYLKQGIESFKKK